MSYYITHIILHHTISHFFGSSKLSKSYHFFWYNMVMVSGFYMIIPDIWNLIGSICHVSSFIPISFLSHSYDFHSHYPHKWFWVITHMFNVWNMNPNCCPNNQPLGAHEPPKTWDQNHRCHDVSRYLPKEITHICGSTCTSQISGKTNIIHSPELRTFGDDSPY